MVGCNESKRKETTTRFTTAGARGEGKHRRRLEKNGQKRNQGKRVKDVGKTERSKRGTSNRKYVMT